MSNAKHLYQRRTILKVQGPLAYRLNMLVKRKSLIRSFHQLKSVTEQGSYHNYLQYLPRWTDTIANGSGSTDLDQRPKPVAMMYDNTTVEGSWINKQNMTQVSIDHGRIINNISMAMPHTGVFAATRDPINNIMQPQDPSVSRTLSSSRPHITGDLKDLTKWLFRV